VAGVLLAGCPATRARLEDQLEGKWAGTKTVAGVTCAFAVEFKDGQMSQTADGTGGPAATQTAIHEKIVFDIANLDRKSLTVTQTSVEYTQELSGTGVTDAMRSINEIAESAALSALQSRNGTEVTMFYFLGDDTLTLEGVVLTRE